MSIKRTFKEKVMPKISRIEMLFLSQVR